MRNICIFKYLNSNMYVLISMYIDIQIFNKVPEKWIIFCENDTTQQHNKRHRKSNKNFKHYKIVCSSQFSGAPMLQQLESLNPKINTKLIPSTALTAPPITTKIEWGGNSSKIYQLAKPKHHLLCFTLAPKILTISFIFTQYMTVQCINTWQAMSLLFNS